MERKTKEIAVVIIGLTLMLISLVNAQEENQIPISIGEGLIDRIVSSIRFLLQTQFTVYGRDLDCSTIPDTKIYKTRNQAYYFNQEKTCGGDSFFVNYFRGQPGSDQYINEVYYYKGTAYVTDGDGEGNIYSHSFIKCDASAYWDYKCYFEIYCCPYGTCESNSDCLSGKECSKEFQISQKFPSLGICKTESDELLTHKTKVYRCEANGTATLLKTVSSGNANFCSNPEKNNYLTIGGTSSGVCYSENPCPKIETENELLEKSIPLTEEEWDKSSPETIIAAMCKIGSDCMERENYSVSCDYSEEIKQQNINSIQTIGESKGGITGVCFKLTDSFIGKIGGLFFGKNYCILDEIGKNPEIYGTCRAAETGGICNFFKQFYLFKITKDRCQDGAITLIGGIALLFFLISMIGGKK